MAAAMQHAGREEWITAGEARDQLGMSKAKFAKLLASGQLPSRPSLRDARVKLVRRSDVERIAAEEPQGGHR